MDCPDDSECRGTPSNYYTLTAAEGQDPVRVTYTGEDGIPHISDSFEIIQEGDVFTTYEIALYTNEVEIEGVTATWNGKTYSVDASQTGTLTVRAVEDTEDNAAVSPVVKETPAERLESGTGLIVAKPDTQYTVNNLGIPVPAGGAPSLLLTASLQTMGLTGKRDWSKRLPNSCQHWASIRRVIISPNIWIW